MRLPPGVIIELGSDPATVQTVVIQLLHVASRRSDSFEHGR